MGTIRKKTQHNRKAKQHNITRLKLSCKENRAASVDICSITSMNYQSDSQKRGMCMGTAKFLSNFTYSPN